MVVAYLKVIEIKGSNPSFSAKPNAPAANGGDEAE